MRNYFDEEFPKKRRSVRYWIGYCGEGEIKNNVVWWLANIVYNGEGEIVRFCWDESVLEGARISVSVSELSGVLEAMRRLKDDISADKLYVVEVIEEFRCQVIEAF